MEIDNNRFTYIDNMRNNLVYVVVFLHAFCVFCYPMIFYWSTIDKQGSSPIYNTLLLTLDIFLMPHLLFLSALFIFISLKDKTRFQYLKKRFKRLFIPVIVYVICAGDIHFHLVQKRLSNINPDYFEIFINYWKDFVNTFGISIIGEGKMLYETSFHMQHIWFMSFLFAVTLIILLIPSKKNKEPNIKIDSKNKIIVKTILFSILMSFIYLIAMSFYRVTGIHESSWISLSGLVIFRADQFWMLLFFLLFGLYVYKKEWLTRGNIGSWKFWGFLSTILLTLYIVLVSVKLLPVFNEVMKIAEHNVLFIDKNPMPVFQSSFIIAAITRIILYPILSICLLMFFISFTKKFFNKPNRITSFCSKHSINVYILHYIPIILLQYAGNDYSVSPVLKIIFYTIITIPACLWLSHRLVSPYPIISISFFVLLKLVSLWAGFDFYYKTLLGVTFLAFLCSIFEFVRFNYQKYFVTKNTPVFFQEQ